MDCAVFTAWTIRFSLLFMGPELSFVCVGLCRSQGPTKTNKYNTSERQTGSLRFGQKPSRLKIFGNHVVMGEGFFQTFHLRHDNLAVV